MFIIPLIETDVPIGLATEETIMQKFTKKCAAQKVKNSKTEKCTRFMTTESVGM